MIRWVVTGPAGAGKSEASALLAARGAAVLDGDRLGHEILARPRVAAEIARRFGDDAAPEGRVDRRRLGRIVFADPSALADLNRITHPPLERLMEERFAELETTGEAILAVLEAAVYFLLPSPPRCDLALAITAAREVRIARMVAGGMPPERAADRCRSQAGLEDSLRRADVVLRNEGTRAELDRGLAELLRRRAPGILASDETHDKDGTK